MSIPAEATISLRRFRPLIVLSVVTGAVTGLLVALFDRVVATGIFEHLLEGPVPLQVAAPLIGLVLAFLALRYLAGGASPSTADEYIKAYHNRDKRMPMAPVLGRLVASAMSLGTGAALGFEGPSIYIGSAVGSSLQHRLSRYFSREDTNVLLVAGAAAGVAAIFKAPATGAIFALEVPFQADLARRALLPALFSAGSGYLVFVAINNTTPLFPVANTPGFGYRELLAALALGVLAGAGARLFARLLLRAKKLATTGHPAVRIGLSGAAIGALVVGGRALTGESLVLGSGYQAISWALEPNHAVIEVLVLFFLRAFATAGSISGGGVGGLFVPLVVQGALLGRVIGGVLGPEDVTLFPVLGVAAFLGAGYRVPLAAVMFVAETTGKAGFVVPGIFAAAASQLVMGSASVSTYQRASRTGHLERRFRLPVATAMRTDALSVPPDVPLQEFFDTHLLGLRLRVVPVVDKGRYCGMVSVDELGGVDRSEWDDVTVGKVARTDVPVGSLSWNLGQALSAMEDADVDRLVIVDDDEQFVGVVTSGEVLRLDEALRAASPPEPDH